MDVKLVKKIILVLMHNLVMKENIAYANIIKVYNTKCRHLTKIEIKMYSIKYK